MVASPLAAASAAAIAVLVAANSQRKRRREGGPDNLTPFRLPPGGRGGTRTGRKLPEPRYKDVGGKAAWQLQPQRTQAWLNFIENEEVVKDPSTVLGKEFKAKFRVSYQQFEQILADTRASGKFPDETAKKAGQQPHPLALKVMAALRRLALGTPVDGLSDMFGISSPVLFKFIPQWERWFVEYYFDEHVKVPTGEALEASINLFRSSGCIFPQLFPRPCCALNSIMSHPTYLMPQESQK